MVCLYVWRLPVFSWHVYRSDMDKGLEGLEAQLLYVYCTVNDIHIHVHVRAHVIKYFLYSLMPFRNTAALLVNQELQEEHIMSPTMYR